MSRPAPLDQSGGTHGRVPLANSVRLLHAASARLLHRVSQLAHDNPQLGVHTLNLHALPSIDGSDLDEVKALESVLLWSWCPSIVHGVISLRRFGYQLSDCMDFMPTMMHGTMLTYQRLRDAPSSVLNFTPAPLSFRVPSYLTCDSTRDTRSMRARIRFQRTGLRSDLFRQGLADQADCPRCPGILHTAEHFVLRCPRTRSARSTLFSQCPSLRGPSSLDAIVDPHPMFLDHTSTFLRACNRIHRL
jgi:hypothetical protein